MGHEFEGIKKDIAMRQNREITTAQDHDIENAKRYTKASLDAFVKDVKDKSFISNAPNPKKALWDYELHKLSNTLNRTNLPLIPISKTNNTKDIVKAVKNNKSTIINLELLDVKREQYPQKIKIKYPIGLLDEFIAEYRKIIGWMEENKYDAITLEGADTPIQIYQHEFDLAIAFFEKMKLVSEDIK